MPLVSLFKFVNWITGTPTPIEDGVASAFTLPVQPQITTALDAFIKQESTAVFGASGANHSVGLVPDPGAVAGTSNFLREDSTWANPTSGLPYKLQGFLINGNGMINQRGDTGLYAATFANDTYGGPDRWYNLAQTAAFAPTTGTALDTSTPYYTRITQSNAAAQRFGRAQIVETRNCNFASGSLVLSGKIRCSAATNIRYAILNWTSTADAVTSNVVNDWTSSTYTAGNFFLAANLEVVAVGVTAVAANTVTTIADLTGSLAGFATNLIAFIWTESTQAQNVTLDFVLKLEQGATSTPYYFLDAATVLNQCIRYYQSFYWAIGGDASGFGSRIDGTIGYPPKRTNPTTTRLATGPTVNVRAGDPNTYVVWGFAGILYANSVAISVEANAAGFTEAYNMVNTAEAEL